MATMITLYMTIMSTIIPKIISGGLSKQAIPKSLAFCALSEPKK